MTKPLPKLVQKGDAYFVGKKITNIKGLEALRENFRNRKIGLCHGAFDAIHIGHIEHLEEARRLCDLLVVSLTGDKHISKHPRGTYHSSAQRAHLMESLNMVDYVYIDDNQEALEVIEYLQPDCYFKGRDYMGKIDENPALKREADQCRRFGGDIVFTEANKHSSSHILNNFLDERRIQISEYLKTYNIGTDAAYLEGVFSQLRQQKPLVLGESIIDIYAYGRLTGVSSKYTAASFLQNSSKTMAGGVLALVRLLADITKQVHMIVPKDFGRQNYFEVPQNADLAEFAYPLIEKTRFIAERKRERLFEAVRFIGKGSSETVAGKIRDMIEANNHTAVLIYDFGHGFFDAYHPQETREDQFFAINVQANSTNYPFNDVWKYRHYHLITMDERELRLATRDNKSDVEKLIDKYLELSPLAEKAYHFFTMGDKGAVAYYKGERIYCPALVSNVVDATGSGDVFHAVAAMCVAAKIDMATALFFASLYGGLYAKIEGHDGTIERSAIIKAMASMK